MPTIELDGTVVQLNIQKRPAFEAITALVFDDADDQRSVDDLYALHVGRLQAEGRGLEDPVVQAGLWALHDLGARSMRRTEDGDSLQVVERVDSPASRGDAESFGFASVRDGRAFAAAIANIRGRSIRFNGTVVPVSRNSQGSIEAVMNLISQSRLVDEDLLMTTVRVIAALVEQPDSPEMQGHIASALEIATDLGIDDLTIEADGSVELGRLNVGNALASAVLQGFTPDDVMKIRKRLDALNDQEQSLD